MVTRTKKIFVGGLSAPTTLEDVKSYFEQFGPVSKNPKKYLSFPGCLCSFFHFFLGSMCVCECVLIWRYTIKLITQMFTIMINKLNFSGNKLLIWVGNFKNKRDVYRIQCLSKFKNKIKWAMAKLEQQIFCLLLLLLLSRTINTEGSNSKQVNLFTL